MNRPVVGLVALGTVLATVLLVTLAREQPRGAVPAVDEAPVVVESAELAREAPLETSNDSAPDAPDPASSQREIAPSALADELADAHWIEGLVVFPPGTPLDEEAFVVARGKEFSDGELQRARVERDGRFRVAFAKESKRASLGLEALYLYLEKDVPLNRQSAGEPVVLEPRLGARLTGRLVLPAGTDPTSIRGKVKVFRTEGSKQYERDIGDDLTFELRALRADGEHRVEYEGDAFTGSVAVTELEAGRTVHVELELERGAELSGRVVDESGAGLAKISVRASIEGARVFGTGMRVGKSGPDGAFRITGLPAGRTRLLVNTRGYANAQHSVGTLAAGEVREGIELVLRRGNAIAGRVQWADGTPVKEVTVEAMPESPWNEGSSGGNGQATSAADGTFEVAGLGDVPYRVRATAWTERRRGNVIERVAGMTAFAEQVAVGTNDLVLVLSAGHELVLQVADDLGAPVRTCRVRAMRLAQGSAGGLDPHHGTLRTLESEDGSFRLDGLAPGEWELTASGKGYGNSQPVRATVPAADPVVLTLPREARVSGVVVDPDGGAVHEAHIHAEQSQHALSYGENDGKTDERGAFELHGLHGPVFLTASADGWAPSVALLLELAPGEVRTDVVLRLGQGGRITGEVRERTGAGVANVPVYVTSLRTDYSQHLWSDGSGRFEVLGVPAGGLRVIAELPDGFQVEERVELERGESAHVVLQPNATPVRVHGRVLLGGEPLGGARLEFLRQGGGATVTLCDDEGAYEVVVEGPGAYELVLSRGAGLNLSAAVEIPPLEDFAFDLAIAAGRISGTVRDDEGEPLGGVLVDAEPPEREPALHARNSIATDEAGRYELVVPEGTYIVRAGGRSWQNARDARSFVEARAEGVEVDAGAHVRGVDFVLARGGVLRGVVKPMDDGGWTAVLLAPASGGEARRCAGVGEDGRFRVSGVPRGSWLVAARTGVMLSDWVAVEVEPGVEREVELELTPATSLLVRVRDADSASPDATVRVVEANGASHLARRADDGSGYWAGPFHAGPHRVEAESDGRVTERTVEIAGGEERMELELVLE